MIVIFDLDGTLSDADHRLHYIKGEDRDWDGFYAAAKDDAPNTPVIQTCQALADEHYISIWTGRSDAVKSDTESWLDQYSVPFDKLYMREKGDHTEDNVLKKQWLDDDFPDGDYSDILCAFEDRDRMVKMYRDLGITCLQVAPGDF